MLRLIFNRHVSQFAALPLRRPLSSPQKLRYYSIDLNFVTTHAPPSTVYDCQKKLIVLDLNGLLVDMVSPPPKYCKADAIIGRKAMFKRPFYLEFLNFCFEKFEVADLSYCTKTSFKTLENEHKPLVFKDLRKIWEKHDSNLPWEKGYFNQSNTLLLDDSPYKALLNPPYNSVFPHTFNFQNKSDNSLAAGGDLRQYLDGLANAENMVKYVEQHPFGQEAINERSQSWNFYLNVIDSLST
ncbi:hypothetical protein HKD37_08G022792 [Glycine soja]